MRDRQSSPRSALAAIAALEGLERAREQGGVHADAGVFDSNRSCLRRTRMLPASVNRAALLSRLPSITPSTRGGACSTGSAAYSTCRSTAFALELVAHPRDRILDNVADGKSSVSSGTCSSRASSSRGFHQRFHRGIRGLDARAKRAPRTFRQKPSSCAIGSAATRITVSGVRSYVAGIASEIALARHAGIHATPNRARASASLRASPCNARRDALRGEHVGVGSRRIPARTSRNSQCTGRQHALGGLVAQPGRGGDRAQRDQDRRQHRPAKGSCP